MRVVSAAEAVSHIRSGDHVFVHGAAAVPNALLAALMARAADLRDVVMTHLHVEGPAPHLAPEMAAHFRHRALFIGSQRAARGGRGAGGVRAGLPVRHPVSHASRLDTGRRRAAQRDPARPPRLLLARHLGGRGAGGGARRAAGDRPAQPGDAAHARRQLRTARRASTSASRCPIRPPPCRCPRSATSSAPSPPASPLWSPIGRRSRWASAPFPTAVALSLTDHRDLGIHSEMFTDVVVELVERGVVTGAYKEVDRGKIVSAFVIGTQRALRLRRRQRRGRDATRPTTPTTAPSSAASGA